MNHSAFESLEGTGRLVLSAEQHDETVARVSHLPHAMAALLMLQAQRGDGLDLASTGLLDATRIASGNPRMWEEILLSNRKQIRRAIGRMVNDPAFRDEADGICAYPIIPFARAWFGGSGIGYVLGE